MKNENNYGIQHLIDISRFHDYLKLLRVTAYVICFVKNEWTGVTNQTAEMINSTLKSNDIIGHTP